MRSAAAPRPPAIEDVAAYARGLLEAAAALPRAGLHRRWFSPFGLPIEGYFTDPAYADMAAANIASTPGNVARDTATLFLVDAASIGWAPPLHMAEEYHRPQFNAAMAAAGLRSWYLPAAPMWQVYSPGLRVGVQLVATRGRTPPWESGGPLRTFIHWALPDGARLCHAGTVGVDGAGVLLVGAGGSGKSGTTLAGIAAGLETVGDDYCIVAMGPQSIEARPVFRILKQDPGGVRRVYGPDADHGPVNWQGKWEIHVSRLERPPLAERLALKAIVMPKVALVERSEIRPIPAPLALRAFMPSNVAQLPDGEAEGVRFTAELCRRLPTFELLLSRDPDDIAAAIAGLVGRLS
ncbi:MAG: serine kinase [Bauldia sp.]|nr:serine kinase [Bauldia sp.]